MFIREMNGGKLEIIETDDSFVYNALKERIFNQYKEHGCLILAVDLDDTIRCFKSQTCDNTLTVIKTCQNILNCITIIYTANTDIEANIKFLTENKVHYDSINCYPDNFPIKKFKEAFDAACKAGNPPPKLYYNILLDDKSCGLGVACDILEELCLAVLENKLPKEDF